MCVERNNKFIIAKAKYETLELNYKDELLATISINDINLYNKPLYKIDSSLNNIEKNITILKESIMPDSSNSIIFLAAHSGIGERAYFKNLHKLNLNNLITINYNNKIYTYKIISIYEESKSGNIVIHKRNEKELVLTTCSENENKQLIVEAILTQEN